ncbi:MAG: hypothetical protein GY778_18120 [bacterium]|nr:hypothetical protein [bacterium]
MVAGLAAIQRPANAGVFDPVVLDAGLRAIPPFRLGACVDLSDGRPAAVTDLDESDPCRPKGHLLQAASSDDETAYEELDLPSEHAPAIVRAGEQQVVAETLYALPERAVHCAR